MSFILYTMHPHLFHHHGREITSLVVSDTFYPKGASPFSRSEIDFHDVCCDVLAFLYF